LGFDGAEPKLSRAGSNVITFGVPNSTNLFWSPWIALDADLPTCQCTITRDSGLYRIRPPPSDLNYIGQAGRNLRERTKSLATHV
jgi:hypothetical protein